MSKSVLKQFSHNSYYSFHGQSHFLCEYIQWFITVENPTRKMHVCSISTWTHNRMHVCTHSESNVILSRTIVLKNCIYIFESFVNFLLAIAVRATNTFYYFLKTSHLLNFYLHTLHIVMWFLETFLYKYTMYFLPMSAFWKSPLLLQTVRSVCVLCVLH